MTIMNYYKELKMLKSKQDEVLDELKKGEVSSDEFFEAFAKRAGLELAIIIAEWRLGKEEEKNE